MKAARKICPELNKLCKFKTKQSLSPTQQHLIELLQTVHFGRLENLIVRAGQPIYDPPPRIVREIKFGGNNEPKQEFNSKDFLLKTQVVQLLQQLEKLGDGTVQSLEIKHGLPFRMIVEETAA